MILARVVLSRILAHDWTFDPRGSNMTLVLRLYHEQDQVLYEPWKSYREVHTAPESKFDFFWCRLCVSREPALPFFVATNYLGENSPVCCPCAAALGFSLSPEARAVCSLPPQPLPRFPFPRFPFPRFLFPRFPFPRFLFPRFPFPRFLSSFRASLFRFLR